MNTRIIRPLFLVLLTAFTHVALADMEGFTTGPVISAFGQKADVKGAMSIPENTEFSIVFDAAEGAEPGTLNRTFNSAARFINMHVDAGVPAENISIAIVVHGSASFDLTVDDRYSEKHDKHTNASATAIVTLQKHGVRFYLCGQSAAAHGIKNTELLPGVKMALSAMTAHALLQQDGYTLNPF